VRHILFNKDQKQKAEDVKKQLEDGANFAKLAKKYSQDPGSAQKGGDLGCLGKGETVPDFEEAAFGAKQGEIVGPVKTQFGYHVLEVTDVKPKQTRPLSEVKSQITAQLSSQKQSEEFSKWLDEQKKKRDVKYLKGYKPATQG
jgi:parvulin-like peptidyl-prolyl isomerase